MHKYIFAAALVLSIAFSCSSPNALRFSSEHEISGDDPLLAASAAPSLGDRLEYGSLRVICPGKTLNSLESLSRFIISSGFVKSLLAGSPYSSAIAAGSGIVAGVLSDALSPDARGYTGTKAAMGAAIGAAMNSGYSCSSIEKAAGYYYSYSLDDYISDICAGKNPIKRTISLLGDRPSSSRLVAVEELPDWYEEIEPASAELASAIREGTLSRRQALERLIDGLSELPLCHEASQDYIPLLRRLADEDSPAFFPLYWAVRNFREDCPFNYSGFYLSDIRDGVVYLSNGSDELPVAVLLEEEGGRAVELIPQRELNFSGLLPLKGRAVEFRDFSIYNGTVPRESPRRLGSNYLFILPLVAVLLLMRWRDEKGS